VCHGFRLTKQDFWVDLTTHAVFFEAAGAALKIGLSLKSLHHRKFSLLKSVKRSVTVFSFIVGENNTWMFTRCL